MRHGKRGPVSQEKLREIRMVVFDFDGVFTNGKVIVDENGKESSICSRKDTLRFPELTAAGIQLAVISQERNSLVSKRCQKMNVACYQGITRKLEVLRRISQEKGILLQETAYVGDDINDLECMDNVSVAFTVADGHPRCKELANYVTERNGGDHAVREICDFLLENFKGERWSDR
jgi:YrbI family 3-deoxy-D-manno-octulosonate 8-phosphate phosphatase